MQNRRKLALLLGLCACLSVCGSLSACGRKEDLSASWEEGQKTEDGGDQAGEGNDASDDVADGEAGDGVDAEDVPTIFVQILGAVENPGVYEVPENSRLFQVLELAGGFNDQACRESVNQAAIVRDEQQIYVYTCEEMDKLREAGEAGEVTGNGNPAEDVRVNINTAGKDQLMTLPGIGESKAESIIQYREKTGKFSSIEDIMKVDGIKEGVYNKIREQITI